ncbi:hypothetical protein EDC01DRAFT_630702 [Geopyxis carbonaria]|nr:hypothetical protein EDC01DRAFT_630702 [Geopyxis carbonaria]
MTEAHTSPFMEPLYTWPPLNGEIENAASTQAIPTNLIAQCDVAVAKALLKVTQMELLHLQAEVAKRRQHFHELCQGKSWKFWQRASDSYRYRVCASLSLAETCQDEKEEELARREQTVRTAEALLGSLVQATAESVSGGSAMAQNSDYHEEFLYQEPFVSEERK